MTATILNRAMLNRSNNSMDAKLSALLSSVRSLHVVGPAERVIARLTTDLAATRFHLSPRDDRAALIAVVGGTGTGKSTLVNRLLDANESPLTATSVRRTFTAGAVAVAASEISNGKFPSGKSPPGKFPSGKFPSGKFPSGWLGFDHVEAIAPAQGRPDLLTIVRSDRDLLKNITLIDTPDLDGDQPAHHAQADRVFRWCDAVIFLVTPEKYQMTELLPYYRLARRYEIPALFVMNKVEESAVVEDFAKLLESSGFGVAGSGNIFAIARDDSSFQSANDLLALKKVLPALAVSGSSAGVDHRVADLVDRLQDQVIEPLRVLRHAIDRTIASLRAMESPSPGVDVSPLMLQLRRRLQQRSVLYLMGPNRVLDRVRQVPSLLARLPRTAWDWVRTGEVSVGERDDNSPAHDRAPDFHAMLVDQMRIVQARIEDVVSTIKIEGVKNSLIDPEQAGKIADEEVAGLRDWLTKKWNANPRDTAILTKLIRHLPGGEKLAKWSEAAPYLLAIVVAAHHAFFGPIDLMVLGGWSLATWITEKLSNEVAWRARDTNQSMNRRFAQLAHQQITDVCAWLDTQAPSPRALDELQQLGEALCE